ncbi:TlpA disulfide reductase family protein [Aeromicrobium panaciterrae]|uniref:TlpA family protein disulfide reductase n=1 Tax=Aeromicrobium panaciterrae TaxID=363861 RepID=UPI0031D99118
MALVLVAGCSGAGNRGSTGGYVTANGQITKVDEADRKPAPTLEGEDLEGRPFTSKTYAGKTIVVNVWGSWCPPCRKEAPALKLVADEYADKGVQFMGILVRDDAASAKAFNRKVGISYPSIDDYSNRNSLGFASSLPAQAIPTTWIIDSQGRVAVRIVSENLTASTLSGLIDDVLAGDK